ncbi:MAG: class III extradiol ring-cleavage dioxygenase [Pseudobdellovibrio sp.]
MKKQRMPALFISHGGGPWPYIPEMKEQFSRTAQWIMQLPAKLPQKPTAILSISGHWEESEFTVSTAKNPEMIFDYSGFPDYTYQIKYPAQGSPEIANEIQKLLLNARIRNHADGKHGFDHGTFVPLVLMYPNAEIPVISMSLKANYNPSEHFAVGQAIQSLRNEGVLIIGSGLSYHNMRGFGTGAAAEVSKQFGDWLSKVIAETDIEKRKQMLMEWEAAPSARAAHPQEDHLLPLMVVVGAAGLDLGHDEFIDHVHGVDMASYIFG